MQKLVRQTQTNFKDEKFIHCIESVIAIVSRILSLAMVLVIIVTVVDLGVFLVRSLLTFDSYGFFQSTLTEIFGLFLSVLIAFEILENITAYLKKHVVEVELVLATSLTAIGRKLIILDLEKISGVSLIGLGVALLALSISYWIVRTSHR
ncbi:MAG: phosphate-starvation-inducible PsiE family protein [Leptolyngbyaceae cyanobacterium SM1_1_3]|nr:phosphate-starvation-inducible PsiE family protein [Leptolyngbyaceae cyanobacterium SM1_1_3]NJN03550.1 phosphate-starvation-inducible PsiE family protein [Leptolyngbyaceae cyanobacterium RM1_1_2]NJO10661.1 phosphate-starvation-inducible PsiE family protein [Leptolyngbyaceae cyanobacterium SL_1_1]